MNNLRNFDVAFKAKSTGAKVALMDGSVYSVSHVDYGKNILLIDLATMDTVSIHGHVDTYFLQLV